MARKNDQQQHGTVYSIAQAAEYIGVSKTRIRSLIKQEKLHIVERTLPDSNITVRVLEQDELDRNKVERETQPRSKDGKKAYVVRLSPDQVDQLVALGLELEPHFKPKTKVEIDNEQDDDGETDLNV